MPLTLRKPDIMSIICLKNFFMNHDLLTKLTSKPMFKYIELSGSLLAWTKLKLNMIVIVA